MMPVTTMEGPVSSARYPNQRIRPGSGPYGCAGSRSPWTYVGLSISSRVNRTSQRLPDIRLHQRESEISNFHKRDTEVRIPHNEHIQLSGEIQSKGPKPEKLSWAVPRQPQTWIQHHLRNREMEQGMRFGTGQVMGCNANHGRIGGGISHRMGRGMGCEVKREVERRLGRGSETE